MYLSLNWLKDYVDIPGSQSPEELGKKLTMHTVEIDSVESQAKKFAGVVVGEIKKIKKHPNADKLQLAEVFIGNETLEIVCGATNIEAGQKVPVALVGARLQNGTKIEEASVRGVKSRGMLCAEDEIGLGDDHAGILILDKKAKPGEDLAKHLKLDDVIFEVDNKSITHRPDLWSHWGISREIAAFLNTKQHSSFSHLNLDKIKTEGKATLRVKIEDYSLCPRYMGVRIDGVKIKASPKWLADRLVAVGVRPINNIVDITNYVLFELGQPLHAFNSSKIDEIIVRQARDGEEIETLDGEKRKLNRETLVIADSKQAVAVAGVMGGADTEIDNDTTSLVIESANFNFISIRKTSQMLGLRTEASIRFEKSLDPNLCEQGLLRAIELIKKICPQARLASKITDEKKFTLNQGPILLNLGWLKGIIGQEIEYEQVERILIKLGFAIERKKDAIKVTVPSWRATRDISSAEDIAEEIVRIYGYGNIEPVMPRVEMKRPGANDERRFIRELKLLLSQRGALNEVYNYSFVGSQQLDKLGINYQSHIKLANPISSEQTMLRQSLVPNLIKNVVINQPRFETIKIFEIGSIYSSIPGELNKQDSKSDKLPYQELRLGICIAGDVKINVLDELKSVIMMILPAIFMPTDTKPDWADKQKSANIVYGGKEIGCLCEVDSRVAKQAGLKKATALTEISIKDLLAASRAEKDKFVFQEYEKYPPLIRDLAFVVDVKVLYNDIRDEIIKFHDYIKEVELFDVYSGGKLGEGKKNLAFRVHYQAGKTLRSEEVDIIQKELLLRLDQKFDAKIRDF